MTPEFYVHCCRRVQVNDSDYRDLYQPDLPTWPVPWFGRLEEADVITVGVNPSWQEFDNGRWATIQTHEQAGDRLRDYFENPVARHDWFETWEHALAAIDTSYQRHGATFLAAHADLSPRATRSMSRLHPDAFVRMVAHDLTVFAMSLLQARQPKAILVAGCVTRLHYAHEFLERYCRGSLPLRFDGEVTRKPGPGFVSFHRLTSAVRSLPVFFCSTSPSSRQHKGLLVQRVREHSATISAWLQTRG